MPRISPRLFRQALGISRSIVQLLPVCRDIRSAQNEFRWLKEHAIAVRSDSQSHASVLLTLIARRAAGEPLQYIVGSEWFGDLEIKCRPGVLIPRQETAACVSYLVKRLNQKAFATFGKATLRILDLCTGTGCIPLLFHHECYSETTSDIRLEIIGVDLSSQALSLARANLVHQIADQRGFHAAHVQRTRSLHGIGFVQADVLKTSRESEDLDEPPSVIKALQRLQRDDTPSRFDILLSNPPYISPAAFERTTAHSVRDFEPKLALVPPKPISALSDVETGDSFYPELLRIAAQVDVKCFWFEVADIEQAQRVAGMALGQNIWDEIEIWRDEPGFPQALEKEVQVAGRSVRVRGRGNGRAVFGYRHEASGWLRKP